MWPFRKRTKEIEQPAGLISVLRDKRARPDERGDAAGYLTGYGEPQAFEALVAVGSDPTEDEYILRSVGESIAEIWNASGTIQEAVVTGLAPSARDELVACLRPDLRERLMNASEVD